ncbi:DcrB family lipoprotein [Rosenbergiella australiborealis]|uniref:DcrB family lipoprotein n=1 Tax=Rosenbergiella australiborealis TaxID=1544696 RepID=A0ABS5T771_9GAMM|nr:DcrB family lipoprotein [Rosenbergiella australiborealis]MBT0727365.1 DcrB family lipoprotein [Rosenbergiella australiborealis]
MRPITHYLSICLVVLGLSACDQKKDVQSSQHDNHSASQNERQNISLLDGKLTFSLPTGMSDQTGKLGTESNNMHVYADSTGQEAVIVIIGDGTTLTLPQLSQKLQQQQRDRDPQLQVVTDKAITLGSTSAQQLDSVVSTNNHSNWSTVVLTKLSNQLITIQISLPADNQSQSQATASEIVKTIVIH